MLPKIHDFVLNKIFSIALLLKGGSGILSNKHEGNIEGSNQAFIFERVIDMTRLLNYKQSLVIIAAIILIVGSALYTPYKGTASYATLSLTRYLGYHPFFSPPRQKRYAVQLILKVEEQPRNPIFTTQKSFLHVYSFKSPPFLLWLSG